MFGLAIVLLLTLVAQRIKDPFYFNANAASLFHCSQSMLAGKVLYVDFREINPPLIFFINLVPAYFASVFHLNSAVAFSYFVIVITLLSLLAIFGVLRSCSEKDQFTYSPLLLSPMLPGLLYPMHFGEREHLFVLLFLPYLVLRGLRGAGTEVKVWPVLALVIGAAAAVGAAIKPYFLFIVLCVEVCVLMQTRNRKAFLLPECAGFASGILSYALVLLNLPENVRQGYIETMRDAWGSYYIRSDTTIMWMILNLHDYRPLSLCFAAAVIVGTLMRKILPFGLCLVAFAISSHLVFVMQAKNFEYHTIPLFVACSCSILLSGWQIARLANRGEAIIAAPDVSAVERDYFHKTKAFIEYCLLATITLASITLIQAFSPSNARAVESFTKTPLLNAIRKRCRNNDSVTFITANLFKAYPLLVYAQTLPGSRYGYAYPFTLIQNLEKFGKISPQEANQLRTAQADSMIGEAISNRPKLIILDECPLGSEKESLATLFKSRPKFQTAIKEYSRQELSDYTLYWKPTNSATD